MKILKGVMWFLFFLMAWLYTRMVYILTGFTLGIFISSLIDWHLDSRFFPALLTTVLWAIGVRIGFNGPETPESLSTEIV